MTEPRAGRQEGDGGAAPGEHEEQSWIEDQGPGGRAPVEGKVQEAAEGPGGGEGPGSGPHGRGLAGVLVQVYALAYTNARSY